MLIDLRVAGRGVLASTPWAPGVAPAACPAGYRGASGSTAGAVAGSSASRAAGLVDPASSWPQGFHGVASQAPWCVMGTGATSVLVEWADDACPRRDSHVDADRSGAQVSHRRAERREACRGRSCSQSTSCSAATCWPPSSRTDAELAHRRAIRSAARAARLLRSPRRHARAMAGSDRRALVGRRSRHGAPGSPPSWMSSPASSRSRAPTAPRPCHGPVCRTRCCGRSLRARWSRRGMGP